MTFSIPAGSNVAFMGLTGSGKSTVIPMIEWFYDPTRGTVLLDSNPVSSLCVAKYRQCIGLEDEGMKPSDEVVEEACRQANIYDFITQSLP